MNSRTRQFSLTAGLSAALLALSALPAHARAGTDRLYGSPVANGSGYDRQVVVTPATRWVNVTDGDTLSFVSGDGGEQKNWMWHFDSMAHTGSVDLRQLAPAGFFDHEVRAYFAANPHASGG